MNVALLVLLLLSVGAPPAPAQCPAPGWNGDEPAAFSHHVDRDRDGLCDRENGEPIVAWRDDGVHPNGFYPDCTIEDGEGQIGHGHWEYTRLQTDPSDHGTRPAESEEKDYLTLPQAMEKDLAASAGSGEPGYENSADGTGQTIRFALNEPVRFDRAIRPGKNPSGRYWQVDEWIGPGSDALGPVPGLTWTERFFTCASESGIGPCAEIDGREAYGGYWSNQTEQLGDVEDCGDALGATPSSPRSKECGLAFLACE